jgi:FkbM family methyltransferase
MLLPLQEILTKYNLKPKGVIHCGAHFAEEHDDYVKCGIERFVYIEPCWDAYRVMVQKLIGVEPIKPINNVPYTGVNNLFFANVACGSEEGEMPMYVSHQNQGQSNSLLKPELHLSQHPEVVFDDAEVVKVVTLDSLPIEKEKYDMLVMDVQGYEGEVLKGATETLKHINIVYTEVNNGETYIGNTLIGEMDELLSDFTRVEIYWPSPNWTWGDAIYIRKDVLAFNDIMRIADKYISNKDTKWYISD